MNRKSIRHMWIFAILALVGMGPASFRTAAAQENASPAERGVEVLAHGPIHEAFAETVVFDPEAGILIPKAPPNAIDEIPPEQKPTGDVEWIPGYWAWDDDRNDFIWVSGVWRVIPPNRQWIPGYWVRSGEGFQWISGYWAAEEQKETEYLPEPPESVEVGPNVSAPSAEYTWIPGCWVWSHGGYAWRPGYWAVMRPNWVWMPAHYVWSPRGYIFVGGYWDFAIGLRGVLFAPVAFGLSVSFGPGFFFTPSLMIDMRVFSDCLFWRPGYRHYYFGDYYAPRYYQRGIYPWFSPHVRRYGYDPIYAHQRWQHRRDRNWERNLHAQYQKRRDHEEFRPPRSLHDTRKGEQAVMASKASGRLSERPLIPVTTKRDTSLKFRPLSKDERTQIQERGKQVHNFGNERQKWESAELARPDGKGSKGIEANRIHVPRSPIAANPTGLTPTKKASPDRHKASETVRKGEPQQRKPTETPGTSKRIETERKTLPRSSSESTPASGPSKRTSQAPAKRAPDRYKAPKTDPTVEPLQRRSSSAPGASKRIERERQTLPKSSIESTPASGPSRPSSPKPERMSPDRQNAPQPKSAVERPQSRPSGGGERNPGSGHYDRGNRP